MFVFGEFHIPARVLLAEHLGYTSTLASDCDFKEFQGNIQGTPLEELKQGNMLKSLIQFACRGSCRDIDNYGVAQQMTLYSTLEAL